MPPETVISLREVARRLPKVLKLQNKTATSRLLSLLKSGDLEAGFRFPGRTERWIPISTKYWAGVGTDKMRCLLYEPSDKRKPGTYKVRISNFADELAQAMRQELHQDRAKNLDELYQTILDEFRRTLSAASTRYEVVVTERAWNNYLLRHNLEEPTPSFKNKAGRPESPSWRALSIIIGSYLIKHQEITKEALKIEEAARAIHEIAKGEGVAGLPAWPTIKDVLSAIRAKAEKLSIS
jgi:hypothetical protein